MGTKKVEKMELTGPAEPAPAKSIPLNDRIKQADAAHILGCSRQRVFQRIASGSLSYVIQTDALGKEIRFVSLKQVQALKQELEGKPDVGK